MVQKLARCTAGSAALCHREPSGMTNDNRQVLQLNTWRPSSQCNKYAARLKGRPGPGGFELGRRTGPSRPGGPTPNVQVEVVFCLWPIGTAELGILTPRRFCSPSAFPCPSAALPRLRLPARVSDSPTPVRGCEQRAIPCVLVISSARGCWPAASTFVCSWLPGLRIRR